MPLASPTTDTTLILKRTFHASRERVFDAWTTPDLLKQWFGPADVSDVSVEELNSTSGGAYRINLNRTDTKMNIIKGRYKEVKRPEKLIFTWSWEGDTAETQVTVTFKVAGSNTEVVLKHEFFANAQVRDAHEQGWEGCFSRFEKFVG